MLNLLKHKVLKIERQEQKNLLRISKDLKKNILKASRKEIKNYLYDISGTSFIPGKISLFKLYFKKMKMIYENLAKCIHRKNFIDGEVWIIEKNYTMLQRNLEILQNVSKSHMGTDATSEIFLCLFPKVLLVFLNFDPF